MAKVKRRSMLPQHYQHTRIDRLLRRMAAQSSTQTSTVLTNQAPTQDFVFDRESDYDNQVTDLERASISKKQYWLKKVVLKLYSLSVKNEHLRDLYRKFDLPRLFLELKKQWVFNWDTEIVDGSVSCCKLCGHKHVNKHFHIENKYNQKIIKTGSECIKQFRIEELSKPDSLMEIKKIIGELNNQIANTQQ